MRIVRSYTLILVGPALFACAGDDTSNAQQGILSMELHADAGSDRTFCTRPGMAAEVTLDGTRSTPPAGTIFTYEWSENGTVLATGIMPTVTLPPGIHLITLVVHKGALESAPSRVKIKVLPSSGPPTLTLVGPESLTLECGRDQFTDPGASATDACEGDLSGRITVSGSVDPRTPGVYTLRYDVANSLHEAATAVTRTVTVRDTLPPEITLREPPLSLWPPNHRLHDLHLSDCAAAADLCDRSVSIDRSGTVRSIYSDEPEDGHGAGHAGPAIVLNGGSGFGLRAERQGGGDGRVYGVSFIVRDASGNEVSDLCKILVPHDQSGRIPVDHGAAAGYSVP